jgi:flagellar hook protein FlgE
MMSSIYSGVSGLKAQQTKLDVIGNNISNVSTIGYKSQTVSFADLLSQTISGSTTANAATGTGGTNAKQIGTGVNVASVSTNIATGSTQSTGNSSDVSISGSGYFIVQGGSSGEYQFTRAGNFGVDASGNLTVNGYTVCGWMDYTYNTQTNVEPINIFSDSYTGNKKISAPAATATATVSGSVNSGADAQAAAATTGSSANATLNATGLTAVTADAGTTFAGTVTVNGKSVTITAGDTVQTIIDNINAAGAGVTAAWNAGDGSNGYIQLTSTATGSTAAIELGGTNSTLGKLFGALDGTTDTTSTSVTAAGTNYDSSSPDATTTLQVYDALGNSYDVQVNLYKSQLATSNGQSVTTWYWEAASADSGLTLSNNSGTVAFDGEGNIVDDGTYNTSFTLNLTPTNGAAASTVTLDLSKVTSYANDSSDSLTNTTDGYASGTLEDYTIGTDGIIYGTYSNGQTEPLGMIALASFTNPAGLEKIGSSLYVTSNNSGNFTGGVVAGTNGTGSLSAGTLEMSNVDLSEQFSEMMITQRAYQASSKIISAADECLKAAINMAG